MNQIKAADRKVLINRSIVIALDLKEFSRKAQGEDPAETARFCEEYYDFVNSCTSSRGWRIVKTMGDCVLIVAGKSADHEEIRSWFDQISCRYDVGAIYRFCEYVVQEVKVAGYRCVDIFGRDVCGLFMKDPHTTTVGWASPV